MTNKVYRTAQGKIVDLGAIQLRNENVRAVGNMDVNARGDRVDSQNRAIDSRTQQVSRQYKRQTSNVQNQSTRVSRAPDRQPAPQKSSPVTETLNEVSIDPSVVENLTSEPPTSGLAAAIARARQITQVPLDPPKKPIESSSIKKI